MNLPNYFLADLPPEATLSAAMISEACVTLKRNRQSYLAERSTESLVRLLSRIADEWLQPENAFRKLALELGPQQTGFGRATIANGIDSFFRQLTREQFHTLLTQDLGNPHRLDEFAPEITDNRLLRVATGPEFMAHITAGNVPSAALTSMVLGLLTRSAQFVKCASGSSLLPKLFAHSIHETDGKLGACLEVAEWPGGDVALESALFEQADCVTATGNDQTLAAIRARLPLKTRFLAYGHRVSFGYVSSEALFGRHADKVIADAASDVVAWNQLGCLSPHLFYVQAGGDVLAEEFAEKLGVELALREISQPRGELPTEIAATIASRRALYEVRAAHSPETRMWRSENSTAWTVVYEASPRFQASCLHRFIYVKPVADLTVALQSADEVRGRVSTVGIASPSVEAQKLALQLARWGVTRVCALGQMQNPPLSWRHDGRPPLGDLVTWTDLEHEFR